VIFPFWTVIRTWTTPQRVWTASPVYVPDVDPEPDDEPDDAFAEAAAEEDEPDDGTTGSETATAPPPEAEALWLVG